MDINKKKSFIKKKKQEVPSHIIEVGLNLLYVEPHHIKQRLNKSQILERIEIKRIFDTENKTILVDISDQPYDEELDNIGLAKQLNPELAVIVKDIILEEYQIFLNRIYQVDAIAFPILYITKKAVEKLMFITNSMGMLPIPIIQSDEDFKKIPNDLSKVIIFEKECPKEKQKEVCFRFDDKGNLVKC